MAIAKMQFVNILGKNEDFDYIAQKYLRNIEIQFQNAVQELHTMHKVAPMDCVNPYTEILSSAEKALGSIEGAEDDMEPEKARMALESAVEFVNKAEEQKAFLIKQEEHISELLNSFSPFADLSIDITEIKNMKFMHFRFGKMPKDVEGIDNVLEKSGEKRENGTYEYYFLRHAKTAEIIAVFVPSYCDREYVWGIYFTALSLKEDVDSVFSSLHFEKMYIGDEIEGNSDKQRDDLLYRKKETEKSLDALLSQRETYLKEHRTEIASAAGSLSRLSEYYNIRKYAATANGIFFLVGWMRDEDAKRFYEMTDDDSRCTVLIEDENSSKSSSPPTALKNKKLFKPFEMYLGLYGLPAYGEMDPTAFMTFSYALLFGIMFGDVGQGLLLLLGGFALYKIKGTALAGIVSVCGFFSTVFGFMYGSIFGNEELLSPLWLRPSHDIMTILISTIAVGAVIIILVMLFNVFVKLRCGEWVEALMSHNGIAGLVFYVTVIVSALSVFTKLNVPGWAPKILIPLSLVAIFLCEPAKKLAAGEKNIFGDSVGMFITQTFFELFEIVLSYLTNTISFVRVGAFALSHAGMMTVVGILMNMAGQGTPGYYIVSVIGNIVVIGIEGLVVSIQVLRLEFYEMFSRFFKGSGRAFEPFRPKTLN